MSLKKMAVLAAGAALLLTGCGGSPASSPTTNAGGLTTVRVGMIPVVENAPIYIGMDEGFFKEEGIDLQVQVIQNAATMVPSMLNGQLDIGTSALPPFLTALEQKVPVQAVSGISTLQKDAALETTRLMARGDTTVARPKDLEGKTVAVNAINSGPHIGLMKTMANDGGDPAKASFVAMPFADMKAAVEDKRVDAAAMAEPFVTMTENSGGKALFSVYIEPGLEFLDPSSTSVLAFASTQYLGQNAETVEKFKAALDKATKVAAEDPQKVVAVMEKHAKIDPQIAGKMNQSGYGTEITESSLEKLRDAMVEVGALKSSPDLSGAVWKK